MHLLVVFYYLHVVEFKIKCTTYIVYGISLSIIARGLCRSLLKLFQNMCQVHVHDNFAPFISLILILTINTKFTCVFQHLHRLFKKKSAFVSKCTSQIEMHMQIRPTDYIGQIFRSTPLVTASWSTCWGTPKVLCNYCHRSNYHACSIAAEFPQR